jgi:hypothetical protein
MSSFLKSKSAIFLSIAVVLSFGTILAVREKSKGPEEKTTAEKATAPKARSVSPELPLPPADDPFPQVKKDQALPVVSNAQISKSTLDSLRKTLAALGGLRAAEHGKGKNAKDTRADRKELEKKIKEMRKEVGKLARESEPARQQILEAVKSESDPFAKKQLANYLKAADDESQVRYYKDLTGDDSVETQKVGVQMLGSVHSDDSLKTLVDVADNPSADKDVRGLAVRSLGMSIPFAVDNAEYQSEAREALVQMVKPQYDPEVRESAYRALAMQTSLDAGNKKLIAQALAQETDPRVRKTAEMVQSIIESRGNAAGE